MSKQASNKQSLPDPELEAILEADRLALEQLFEAADRDLREALEADRLALSAFYSDITVKAGQFRTFGEPEQIRLFFVINVFNGAVLNPGRGSARVLLLTTK